MPAVLSGHFLSSDASLLTAWELPTFIWRAYHANCPCFRMEKTEAERQNNLFKYKHEYHLWIKFKFPGSATWIPALLLLAKLVFCGFTCYAVPFNCSSGHCGKSWHQIEQVSVRPSTACSRCLWHLRAEMHLYDKDKTNDRNQLCNQSLCSFSV